jgi:hypothetical protein
MIVRFGKPSIPAILDLVMAAFCILHFIVWAHFALSADEVES